MASEKAPAFQFYVKEWRSSRSVMRMTFAHRGMYLEMLLEQWEQFSLPDDPEAVAELLGGTVEEWTSAWPILRRKFITSAPGEIHNLKLETVRLVRRKFEKLGKLGARKGGLARAKSASRNEHGTYVPAKTPAREPAREPARTASVASQGTSPPNQPTPASPSPSPSPSPSLASAREYAHEPRATIVQRRRGNAAWEGARGLYVPTDLHARFVGFRNIGNHADAERELFTFYERIAESYAGNIDPDMFRFWTARFAEEWPPTKAVKTPSEPTQSPAAKARMDSYLNPPKSQKSPT